MFQFLICCIISLFSPVRAIVSQPSVDANKSLTSYDLNFIFELLRGGQTKSNMECKIDISFKKEIHSFKDKKVWIEKLEIEFRPNIYSDNETETIVISVGDSYGHRIISQAMSGPNEEFKIEFNDMYNSYVKFSHNGLGKLTGFIYGNIYVIHPCSLQNN